MRTGACIAASNAHGGVIGGPVTNSANGHVYRLLGRTNWTGAEAEAATLDGHLATISDAEENAWIHQTFSVGNGCVWIALWRPPDGRFRWANGELATFRNWAPGEPNHGIGAEEYVVLYVEDRRHSEAASPPAPRDLHPNLHLAGCERALRGL